jgi:hypothetical protein
VWDAWRKQDRIWTSDISKLTAFIGTEEYGYVRKRDSGRRFMTFSFQVPLYNMA